jgi:hypothetical protein
VCVCVDEGPGMLVCFYSADPSRVSLLAVQNVTVETRRIIEALLISAAQREADVAECTAFFNDQAAR